MSHNDSTHDSTETLATTGSFNATPGYDRDYDVTTEQLRAESLQIERERFGRR